jgi:hypothetical protein
MLGAIWMVRNDERTRFIAVLEIPPMESAGTAVRVQMVKDSKERNGGQR